MAAVLRGTGVLLVAVVVTLGAWSSRAQAQSVALGPHLGVNLDAGSPHVGADVVVPLAHLSPSVRLDIWPSYAHVFIARGHDVELLGVDVPFEFAIANSIVTPYVAPGLGLAFYGNTSLKVNLIGGVFFETRSPVRPFTEIAVRLVNGTFVDLLAGVLFEL
jgi:hypothetical protein